MAIELKKTGFCNGCPYFEPETFSAEITSNDNGYQVLETNITCKHDKACKRMSDIMARTRDDLLRKIYL